MLSKHIRRITPRPKKNSKEYFIWCDESDQSGKFFSNFYGGVLVKSENLHEVMHDLQKVCRRLHLYDEIKWQKISDHYVVKYTALMDAFFNLIKDGKIKVRIMFIQNTYKTIHLHDMHKRDVFFILYRQLVKHAFGLIHSNNDGKEIFLRLYFDFLPYTLKKKEIFKQSLNNLQSSSSFQLAGIKIRKRDISEVDSKKHLLLQTLDVVLGAVCFYLNNKHKEILQQKEGSRRTRAKEKVYKYINKRIKQIRKGFNMSTSTGITSEQDHWIHNYRHWRFTPAAFEADNESILFATH
ncbi:MAG TPA: DUF3800 domain-containing protein [Parafilimonas sp.]|nr:DUF3800 domain-containing protein [Parafilimonas sp.]